MANTIEIPLTSSGSSAPAQLTRGRWELTLVADTWDPSTVVQVQYAARFDNEARYQNQIDPVTGSPFARSGNGLSWIHECARGFVRIHAASLGSTTGLTLEATKVGV